MPKRQTMELPLPHLRICASLDAGAAPSALCSALEAMSMSRSARQRATATSEELCASQLLSPSACASFARGAICGTRSRIRF